MTMAEYFDFLPYGKYAFYIWFSYLITVAVIAMLFIRTQSARKQILRQLHLKYSREKKTQTHTQTHLQTQTQNDDKTTK